MSKPSDLVPELQGRFPLRVELSALTKEDFYRILTEPKNALTVQYKALLGTENVEIAYTDEALLEIARFAQKINEETESPSLPPCYPGRPSRPCLADRQY